MPDTTTELTAGVSETRYHADTTSLSSTGARKVLACPARFKWERDNPPPPRAAFDMGHVAHTLILGEGSQIAVIEAPDWRSKAAQAERDEVRAAGAVPILAADYDAAMRMRDGVMGHLLAAQLFAEGRPELSGWWNDEQTGVTLRFRPDWLTEVDGRTVCVDLKTTVSADPDEFIRSIVKFGYHFQASWYVDGLIAHGYDDPRFVIVAVEKSAPHLVSVIELDDTAIAQGRRLNREAIDLYHDCTTTDTWPAYGDECHLLSLPEWALPDLEMSI